MLETQGDLQGNQPDQVNQVLPVQKMQLLVKSEEAPVECHYLSRCYFSSSITT